MSSGSRLMTVSGMVSLFSLPHGLKHSNDGNNTDDNTDDDLNGDDGTDLLFMGPDVSNSPGSVAKMMMMMITVVILLLMKINAEDKVQ